MKNNQEEQLRIDALRYADLSEMPKRMTKKTALWVKAIAKIKKYDGSRCYGIVMRKADLSHRFLYVNGNISRIQEIEEVYPFVVLNNNYIKTFETDDLTERVNYLKHHTHIAEETLLQMDAETLNRHIVQLAMERQLKEM